MLPLAGAFAAFVVCAFCVKTTRWCLRLVFGGRTRTARRAREPPDLLDRVLLIFGGINWTARDACAGLLITGTTGSGKTTGILGGVIDALLTVGGMLAITSKPDDLARILAAAKRAGKSGDVIVISDAPGSHRLNFLEVIQCGVRGSHATVAAVLATAFSAFVEISDRGGGSGGGEDNKFWKSAADRLVRHCFQLMLLAEAKPSLPLLLRLVQSLPNTLEDLNDPAWKERPLNRLLRAAFGQSQNRAEYGELAAYFLSEMAALSGKTKSIVQATVAGVADAVGRGLAGELLATESTFDLARAVEHGAVVVCDIPAEYGEVGNLIKVGLKVMCQTAVLRRKVTPGSPLFSLVIDEFQTVCTETDWAYASRCRGYRGPFVAATQGIESLRSARGGESAKDEIDTLCSNLGTKVTALPTWPTAEWLCKQLGRTRVEMAGGSGSAGAYTSPMDFVFGSQNPGQASGSFTETMDDVLRPDELSGMRTGGPAHRFLVDSMVVQPGKRFDTGSFYCFKVWPQRH